MSGEQQPFTLPVKAVRRLRWPIVAVLLSAVWLATPDEAAARRYASIVVDADTGEVLHADKADRRAYPASLTKMMTLYLLFEAIDQGRVSLNQKLPVSNRASGMPPSKLGLRRGQSIAVKDAIMALVTKSANDVAVVVAEALGGSEQKFARLMTNKAKQLGMSRTTFRNASGLPNNQQLSTARDMSRLAQALQRDFPQHYRVFSARRFSYHGRTYKNHNKLLANYSGTDGIKTGYTHASGFNLVASVQRNGRRLIAVVFGGKTARSRDRHMRKLLDRNFALLAKRGVPAMASLPPRKPSLEDLESRIETAAGDEAELEKVIEQVASKGQPVPIKTAEPALPVTPTPRPEIESPKAAVVAAAVARASDATASMPTPEPRPASLGTGTQGASRIATLSRLARLSNDQGSTDDLPEGVGVLGTLRLVGMNAGADTVSWGVQVGAFTRASRAQHEATKAVEKMPHFLRSSQVTISPSSTARGPIYRARLTGMSESAARLACGALKAKAMNCLVIAPGEG